jgi:hypothetical protein
MEIYSDYGVPSVKKYGRTKVYLQKFFTFGLSGDE